MATGTPAGAPRYPAEWESDVLLSDGGTAHVRPIRPDDAPALVALHSRLSSETVYFRFFSAHPELSPAEVERFTTVDYDDRLALVAYIDDLMVGVARYDRYEGTTDAEVAFVVEDAHQGRGLGTVMLEHLAAVARDRGVGRFVADVLPTNRKMLGVFHAAGFEDASRFADGVVRVTFSIEPTDETLAAMDERDRRAAVRSIDRLLRPGSVAVVGASRRPGTIGHELLRNLLSGDFAGPVYPVNPAASSVAGVRSYATVVDIPDPVDVAVVVVPAPEVLAVVEACGEKGVHGVVVISAGFAETGEDGAKAEREVVAAARRRGMRVVGPNCMGIANTDPDVRMNATFAPAQPVPGSVAFSSQSGALGIAILEEAGRLGVGVSSFVSVGNKADVSGNDLLRYWEQDERTTVVLLYLESFGNPRKFARIARRVSRTKPIVAVKSGRTGAGTRAASSHTAALASPDIAVDALFRQTGVIRVDTLSEFFDIASLLVHQPLPPGKRVAIVGNAGGPGILAADACEGAGLEVQELSPASQAELRTFLPPAASVRNPVDLVASASAGAYERAIATVLADQGVDAAIVIFIPPLVTRADDVARAVSVAAAGSPKPVLANFLALGGGPEELRGEDATVPSFAFPEAAAKALAHAASYAEWRARPPGEVPDLADVDEDGAREVVERALDGAVDGVWLDAVAAGELLGAYGVPVAPTAHVWSAAEASDAATRVGFPAVLKAGSPTIVHKTDVGAVRLDLRSPDEVRAAFDEMEAGLGDEMDGAIVQAMAEPGVEVIVGVVQDALFGPLVMFGTGGTAVELLGDRSFRVLPLTDVDAHELVRSTRGSPLLFGYRGAPPCDVTALEGLLLRVGRLVDDVPELAEMDLNPVIVSATGAVAVDAKIRLAHHRPAPSSALRRLR